MMTFCCTSQYVLIVSDPDQSTPQQTLLSHSPKTASIQVTMKHPTGEKNPHPNTHPLPSDESIFWKHLNFQFQDLLLLPCSFFLQGGQIHSHLLQSLLLTEDVASTQNKWTQGAGLLRIDDFWGKFVVGA